MSTAMWMQKYDKENLQFIPASQSTQHLLSSLQITFHPYTEWICITFHEFHDVLAGNEIFKKYFLYFMINELSQYDTGITFKQKWVRKY